MKIYILAAAFSALLISCQKIEETVNETVSSGKQKVAQKAKETVQETVNEQLNKFVNAKTVQFDSVFPHDSNLVIENATGKKVAFPNGTPFFVFKYKAADKIFC